MWGRCRVCAEKDKRISDLHDLCARLFAVVSPPQASHRVPVVQIEADALLSGRDEQVDVSPDQRAEWDAIRAEANSILSGTY
jgi:hypothetical protein